MQWLFNSNFQNYTKEWIEGYEVRKNSIKNWQFSIKIIQNFNLYIYSNKSTKFILYFIIFLVNNHLHILEWDHQHCQEISTRNTMMPIMTFLAPSFWMNLASRVIDEPERGRLGRKVKDWHPFHFSSFIGWKASHAWRAVTPGRESDRLVASLRGWAQIRIL